MSDNNIKSEVVSSYFFFEVIKKRSPFLFGIIVVVIAIVFSLLLYTGIISKDQWAEIFDPAITIFTLLVASFTTAYTAYIDWKDKLEKRITTLFVFSPVKKIEMDDKKINDFKKLTDDIEILEKEIKIVAKDSYDFLVLRDTLDEKNKQKENLGKENETLRNIIKNNIFTPDKQYILLICFEAILSNEGDLRQWTQQIGKQMNLNKFLDFFPFYSTTNKQYLKITLPDQSTKFVSHQVVVYYLSKLPEVTLKETKTLIWDDNYENTPNNSPSTIDFIEYKELEINDYKKFKQKINNLIKS